MLVSRVLRDNILTPSLDWRVHRGLRHGTNDYHASSFYHFICFPFCWTTDKIFSRMPSRAFKTCAISLSFPNWILYISVDGDMEEHKMRGIESLTPRDLDRAFVYYMESFLLAFVSVFLSSNILNRLTKMDCWKRKVHAHFKRAF